MKKFMSLAVITFASLFQTAAFAETNTTTDVKNLIDDTVMCRHSNHSKIHRGNHSRRGPTGPRGPRGIAGPAGPRGPRGIPGTNALQTAFTSISTKALISVSGSGAGPNGERIRFPVSRLYNPGQGIAYNSDSGIFTVENAGTYQITFGFSAQTLTASENQNPTIYLEVRDETRADPDYPISTSVLGTLVSTSVTVNFDANDTFVLKSYNTFIIGNPLFDANPTISLFLTAVQLSSNLDDAQL